MASQLHLQTGDVVLDFGFGHGFMSFELACRTSGMVVGLDLLAGEQLRIAKGGAKIGGLADRMNWAIGEGRGMPFRDETFDKVVCFLTLQDVYMTGGEVALNRVLQEAFRILKPNSFFAVADNLFPECARENNQRLYAQIQLKEFGAGLPSEEVVLHRMKECGFTGFETDRFNPRIVLNEKESWVELKDIVDARPFGMRFDFEKLRERYQREIAQSGLAYPEVFLVKCKKGARIRIPLN